MIVDESLSGFGALGFSFGRGIPLPAALATSTAARQYVAAQPAASVDVPVSLSPAPAAASDGGGIASQIVSGATQALPAVLSRNFAGAKPTAARSLPAFDMPLWKKVAIGLAVAVPVGYFGYKLVKGKKGSSTP